MKEFDFDIIEPAFTSYSAKLTIKAKSKKDALKKLENMSAYEIKDLCEDWKLDDDTSVAGSVEVYDGLNRIK